METLEKRSVFWYTRNRNRISLIKGNSGVHSIIVPAAIGVSVLLVIVVIVTLVRITLCLELSTVVSTESLSI